MTRSIATQKVTDTPQDPDGFREVLFDLIRTVDSTGGVLKYPDGTCAPAGEPDWIDLGDVYLKACEATGAMPCVTNSRSMADEVRRAPREPEPSGTE